MSVFMTYAAMQWTQGVSSSPCSRWTEDLKYFYHGFSATLWHSRPTLCAALHLGPCWLAARRNVLRPRMLRRPLPIDLPGPTHSRPWPPARQLPHVTHLNTACSAQHSLLWARTQVPSDMLLIWILPALPVGHTGEQVNWDWNEGMQQEEVTEEVAEIPMSYRLIFEDVNNPRVHLET